MIHEEVQKIVEDVNKLKKSIYENKLVLSATKEQEDLFYRLIDSFISRILYHIEQNKELEHVINTIKAISKLEENNDRDYLSYDLNKIKENLISIYISYKEKREEGTNFIGAAEPVVFYPIRIISEKLYRELMKKEFDESLNVFFQDQNI